MGFVVDSDVELTPTSVLVFLLLCLVIHWLIWREKRSLPPAPFPQLPVLGHMHLMNRDMRKTVRPLRQKLGDIYRLQVGSQLIIIIGGYKTIKEAFQKNAELFSDRPYLFTLEAAVQNKGFVNKNGFEWKEHRRFALSTLKDLGMGRRVLETRVLSGADNLVELFKSTGGNPFYPKPMVNTTVWNVIASMLFGDTVEFGDPKVSKILDMVETNMANATVTGILNFFPFLTWLPGDMFGLAHSIGNANKVHAFTGDIVREHTLRGDKTSVDDLAAAYLKTMDEKNANKELTSFSMDNLSGTISDMFIAGTESTTTALCWCIVCLVSYPDIQARLHREVHSCLGRDKTPSVADRTSLAYVEAFWMEVLRFCDLLPMSIPHAVSEETQFQGYTIPKDALILVDMVSVLKDPEVWGDPEVFRPERFLDDNGSLVKKEEYIMFFIGKRSCIGEALARMELFLVLVRLVQHFEFLPPSDETFSVETTERKMGVSHSPANYKVIARLR